MAINITDGFNLSFSAPIDYRMVVDNSTNRSAITHKYDGLKVFQRDNRVTYVWNSNTTSWDLDITGNISVTGVTNSITKIVSGNLVGSAITNVGDNVGINTSDPRGYLQIGSSSGAYFGQSLPIVIHKGNDAIIGYNWYDNSGDQYFDSSKGSSQITFGNLDGSITLYNRPGFGSLSNTARFVNGRLGVGGVTSPTHTLHVNGNSLITGDIYSGSSYISGSVSITDSLYLGTLLKVDQLSGNTRFLYNNSERLTIGASVVSIPTSLTVTADVVVGVRVQVTNNGTSGNPSFLLGTNPNGNLGNGVYLPATNTIGISTGGVERMSISSSGLSVPIGGTAGTPMIRFGGLTGLYSEAAGKIGISVNGKEAFRIFSNGVNGTTRIAIGFRQPSVSNQDPYATLDMGDGTSGQNMIGWSVGSNGTSANIFGEYSSGGVGLAYGLKPIQTENSLNFNTLYVSSYSQSLGRSMVTLTSNSIKFYSNTITTTPIGTVITPGQIAEISSFGVGIGNSPVSGYSLYTNSWVRLNERLYINNVVTGGSTNVYIDGNGLISKVVSSIRYKKDIKDIDSDCLSKILNIRPVTYREKISNDKEYYGLIAEELYSIEPKLVNLEYLSDDYIYNDDGVRTLKDGSVAVPDSIQYDRLAILLIGAIKEIVERIDSLKN